jgi:hypothetical protein
MYIAAYDPGLTTGYARVAINEPVERHGGDVVPFRIVSAMALMFKEQIDATLTQMDNVRIVEDFVGSGHRTVEAIHTLKLVGYLQNRPNPFGEIVMQTPQRRKAFVKVAAQLMEKGGFPASRHAADALAHILYYQYTRKE